MKLKDRILKEMMVTDKNQMLIELMTDNPSLVNYYGEDKFKRKFNKLWKKFTK